MWKREVFFAFLGPNGAGKSTTINMICTFLRPDGGSVVVDGSRLGEDDKHIRENIGIVFQNSLLDDLLTVEENLFIRGSFYNLKGDALKKAVLKAAKATELMGFLRRPYGKLSGGTATQGGYRPSADSHTPRPFSRRTDHRPGPAEQKKYLEHHKEITGGAGDDCFPDDTLYGGSGRCGLLHRGG